MEDIEFDWVTGKVPRVDGAGNSISDDGLSAGGRRRDDGTLSGLAYDLEYADEAPDDASRAAVNNTMIAAAVGIAVGVSATLVYDHRDRINVWLQDKVLNPLRRRLSHQADSGGEVSDTTNQGDNLTAIVPASQLLDEVAAGVEGDRILMGSDEAKERFLQIVLALGVITSNWEALQSSVIVNDDLVELRRAVEILTSERGLSVVNSMLELTESSRVDETQAAFLQVFGGGYTDGSQFIPLRQESLRSQLALPMAQRDTPEHSE